MTMDKKNTLEKWFEEVWTKENTATIHEMFTPDHSGSAKGIKKNQGIGPDEFVEFQKLLLGLLKNIKIRIDNCIEQGDVISAECTLTANDRKTGTKELAMKGCVIGKIVNGKIINANNYFDFLNLFEDLGLLPDNTFATCLSGDQAIR